MSGVMIMSIALQALAGGTQFIQVVESLMAIRERMKEEGREDVSTADLDLFRERVLARHQRIQDA